MRKLILQEFVSVNGFANGPRDSVEFIPASTRGDRRFGESQMALIARVGAILLGRVTYGMFAGYWPHVTDGAEKAFADRLNAVPKVVFSRTVDRAPWGELAEGQIARTNPADLVPKLKREAGRDLLIWGSLSIAHELMVRNLVDEYQLVVCPVVLSDGRPLFSAGIPSLGLTLADATRLDRGAVLLSYIRESRPD